MAEEPNLNITDIADAVKIIDYAAEQGAFRGWNNIRQILVVRDRLEVFVAAANSAENVNTPAPVLNEMVAPVRKGRKRSNRT